MTTVLTIAPLGGGDMTNECGGWAKRQGQIVEVPTAGNLSINAIPDACLALDKLRRNIHDDLIVFAYSQGCQVAGAWLDQYGLDSSQAEGDRIRFVLIGNLERAYFGYAANKPKWIPKGNIRGLTRNTTKHRVLDIGRKDDAWANYPGGWWALLRLIGNRAHGNYDSVNPDDLNPLSTKVVKNYTYVTVA